MTTRKKLQEDFEITFPNLDHTKENNWEGRPVQYVDYTTRMAFSAWILSLETYTDIRLTGEY